MTITGLSAAGLAAGVAVSLATGPRLARRGRPYHALPLTVHKLASVAAVACLVVLLDRASGGAPWPVAARTMAAPAAALVLGAVATGGWAAASAGAPDAALRWHRRAGWATAALLVLSAVGTLLATRGAPVP